MLMGSNRSLRNLGSTPSYPTRLWGRIADINLNDAKARMNVGDTVSADSCTVFFKPAVQRVDRRVGFDVSCS